MGPWLSLLNTYVCDCNSSNVKRTCDIKSQISLFGTCCQIVNGHTLNNETYTLKFNVIINAIINAVLTIY